MRGMKPVIPCCLSLLILACSPVLPGPQPQGSTATAAPARANDPGFPEGYSTWAKLNSAPITREDSGEVRELYRNDKAKGGADGRYPTGAIFVKAQHRLVGGRKGRVYQLAVMTKAGSGPYNGWTFSAYDPDTGKRRKADADVCAICHSQRASKDYIFSL